MKKKWIAVILTGALIMSTLSGCGNSSQENAEIAAQTEDTIDEESEESADKEPEKDDQKAKTYFEAAGDDPYAQILLGQQYYFGKGVDENKAKGRELVDAVIAQGYAEGYAVSGDITRDEEDYNAAFVCYQKASESEELLFAAMAMNQIGYLYDFGDMGIQNCALALEWYNKAADLGEGYAMDNIGYLYKEGLGVEQDSAKAQEWYDKAKAAGNRYE